MSVLLEGFNLVKRFGPTVALGGVGLAVRAGEAVAIMGPSGSGKSTLLHCLAGITKPDVGEVHLRDRRIDAMGERERSALRRTRFGFVFQFGQLLPELPADENVALPLMLGKVSRADAVRQARGWFGPLGLTGMEGRRPGELSGGQAQRVAIARALVIRPEVIFADEPTGALDQSTGYDTMRLLVEATKHNGASLVVVTHDPEVARWCDRVIEVRDGQIIPGGYGMPSSADPGVRRPVHGHDAGFSTGHDAGFSTGHDAGFSTGHDARLSAGHDARRPVHGHDGRYPVSGQDVTREPATQELPGVTE